MIKSLLLAFSELENLIESIQFSLGCRRLIYEKTMIYFAKCLNLAQENLLMDIKGKLLKCVLEAYCVFLDLCNTIYNV